MKRKKKMMMKKNKAMNKKIMMKKKKKLPLYGSLLTQGKILCIPEALKMCQETLSSVCY